MLDASEYLMMGAKMIREHLKAPRIIFGIEDNKPECIDLYKKLTKDEPGMEVHALKAMYPQGGEKVLIYHTIGAVVPEGKLPLDAGAIVINCTTLANIAKYCATGMPLVEKWVTVDGTAVKNPQNVIAPIGMRMKDVFEACGGFKEDPQKVLYGGPMMGISVPDLEQPILKNTNAILAFGKKEANPPKPTACIKCGRCISTCPFNLMPVEIETAYRLGKVEMLDKLKVNICMECGCCSFGCPANRPIVQNNKLAKMALRDHKAKEAKA
jgi:electron transport complex protein RnfC